jgi:hypothetical protein
MTQAPRSRKRTAAPSFSTENSGAVAGVFDIAGDSALFAGKLIQSPRVFGKAIRRKPEASP